MEIAHYRAAGELALPHEKAAALVAAWLSGRSERTLRAYRCDLEDFRAFLEAESIDAAAELLIGRSHGEANGLALAYRSHLLELGLAPATINRRLSALRSLVTLGRTLGFVPWTLEVRNVRTRAYRDTRGPGVNGFERLLAAAGRSGAKAARDRALLWLLFGLALRRGEVAALQLAHVDRDDAGVPEAVWIRGKGQLELERIPLPSRIRAALRDWLDARGPDPGALFRNFDPVRPGDLEGNGIYKIVRALGRRAGLASVRPHGLRHAAITALLESGEHVTEVKRFSRHARLDTLILYDDNRHDGAAAIAERLTERIRDPQ